MLLDQYHAVHDAAVLVEDEMKAHHVVPADHHMPQPEQSTNHHGYQAPHTPQAELDAIDAAQDRYNLQVKHIKTAMEGFLHARGAEGHSVDDAERMWAIAARLTLEKEQKILTKAVEVGKMHQADAKDKLEDQYHAVIEAAKLVEDELKAHHIVPADHVMPTGEPTETGLRTYEQTANHYGYTGPIEDSKSTPAAAAAPPAPPAPAPAPAAIGGSGSIGPRWTYDSSIEAPAGTKDMGSWKASVYTQEQQDRLSVNEKGEPVAKTNTDKMPAAEAAAKTAATDATADATETTTAKVSQKSLRGKQEPTETQESETQTADLIAEPPTPDTSSKPILGMGLGPLIGFIVGGVALVGLVGVGVAKTKSNKEQQSAQRLVESQNTIAVVQGSTDGSASPTRAVTQATFVQML